MTAPATVGPPADLMDRLAVRVRELMSHDTWSVAQLHAHQERRLRSLLAHATAHSAYYRETLGPDAAQKPLHELPVLSKATMMAHFDDLVCDPRLHLGHLEAHLAGPDAATSYLGEYRVLTTSGTTGLRGIFAVTEDEALDWVAVGMRGGAAMGLPNAHQAQQMRMVGIGAPGSVHVTRQLYAVVESLGSSGAPALTVLTPLPEMIEALEAYQPDVLIGYPTVAGMLADEQLAGRLHISPRAGFYGAERLTPGIRDRIRAAWGFEPWSVYAATEAPTIAMGTLDTGLRIAEDVLLVEVVDENNRPVPPSVPGFKVLITNLINRAQPLIRYELSDAVTLAESDSGHPYRRIASVDGRSRDVLVLPGIDGAEVALHPAGFSAVFLRLPAVQQYQIVHDDRGLHARVVLNCDVTPDGATELVHRLHAELADTMSTVGAIVLPIDVQRVAAMERGSGIGAKYKLVESRVRSA
jgi:phenylacetate-CoA ligase